MDSLLYHQTVNYDFNIVFNILIQLNLFFQLIQITVNAYSYVSTSFGLFQYLDMLTLSASYHRCQKLNPCTFRHLHYVVYHLIHRLFGNLFSTLGTVRRSDAGIQQTKIVIYFCNRSHCGTGIFIGGFLVNGNRRGQSFNLFHIRLFHLA